MSAPRSAPGVEAAKAIALAADPKLQMHELVFCATTGHGVKYATFTTQRKRFSTRTQAIVFAALKPAPDFFHFALLFGTRDEVAATPGMMTHAALADFVDDLAVPTEYRWAVAVCDSATGARVFNDVDGEVMRFKTREQAEACYLAATSTILLPDYAATGHELRVVKVHGMDDAFDDEVARKPFEEKWRRVVFTPLKTST